MSIHMILASGSATRADLLGQAGLTFDIVEPRIDEESVKKALVVENAPPRDIADCLAEMKARKVSEANPEALVIACDQVLTYGGTLFSKPSDVQECREQLQMLSGQAHQLLSAAVIYENRKPVWRHIGVVRLRMRELSESYIESYVERNWHSIRHSVGGYKLEEEGVRLFSSVTGDFFHVLGVPLLEMLNYLVLRGDLES